MATNSTSSRIQKTHTLVLEDDVGLQVILLQILRRLDPEMEITWTTSARLAINKLSDKEFDLVLVDIFLDGSATGLDLIRCVETRHPYTPMVIMSGMPYDDFIKALGKKTPSSPFIPKPLDTGKCIQVLGAALGRSPELHHY